uniref:RNase H type-1 domain-containing protein n=1 Tax=Fagus sylvatica TaxID=28930 RepID=A0A2N9JAY5_FAGSY
MVHNDLKINHLTIVKNLEERIVEHWLILNLALTLFGGIATLAVIARDDSGSILQCWTKRCYTIDPCFAEAAALLCALELARDNHFLKIMVEGDAKICIEAISASSNTIPWKIFSIVANIKFLALAFSACSFCWSIEMLTVWLLPLPTELVYVRINKTAELVVLEFRSS